MKWTNGLSRPVKIYGLMLAMLAACTLLGITLVGAVALAWPDQLVTMLGATGLLMGMAAAIAFDRSGLADEAAAIRESDACYDAWRAALKAGANAEELDALYDEWREAYAAEWRLRHGIETAEA